MMKYKEIAETPSFRLGLDVSVSGMKVMVGAGEVICGGIEYDLDDDVEVKLKVIDKPRQVFGFLVRERETGDITVLCDERFEGNSFYRFTRAAPYALIERLFTIDIPSGSSDLESHDVSFIVFRSKKQE